MKSYKKAFTLVEMLILIVIIGILAAALIPRLTGIQARARDVARIQDMRNITMALQLYHVDYGTFPLGECNAPLDYVQNIDNGVCRWNAPGATTWSTEYSMFSGFLSELDWAYLTSVPVDPRHPARENSYVYDFAVVSADATFIKDRCAAITWSPTNWTLMASIWYTPEAKRENDIVRSCPGSNIPRDYAFANNKNRYTYFRTALIFDDKYAPTWSKKADDECFDKNKDDNCS